MALPAEALGRGIQLLNGLPVGAAANDVGLAAGEGLATRFLAAALAAQSLSIYWGQVQALGQDMFAEQDASANAIARAAARARPGAGGDDGGFDDDPCWKVGDDIYKLTKAGNQPKWSTVRGRYWKNAAAAKNASALWDTQNLARMRSGLAPQR
jgi:hypothetical protein